MDSIYIEKILNGDPEAFRYFIRQYKDMAYSLAISIVKDEHKADEVLQSAFVNAYSNLASFKGNSKFSSWLYRIVVNESFKSIRKQKYEQINLDQVSENEIPNLDDFSKKLSIDEQKFYINEALIRLSPNESLALRLFYLEENSIEGITEITGWSSSKAKIILHRARKNMKIILSKLFMKPLNLYTNDRI